MMFVTIVNYLIIKIRKEILKTTMRFRLEANQDIN